MAGSFTNIHFWAWLVLSAAWLLTAFLSWNKKAVFFRAFLLFCLCLGALHIRNYNFLPPGHIGSLEIKGSLGARVQGVVDNDPVSARNKSSFRLRIRKLIAQDKDYPLSGEILVNAFGLGDFNYGDELILDGSLHRPFNFGANTNFSYPDYLKNQGIYYILEVGKGKKVIFLGRDKGNLFVSLAFRFKHRLKGIFEQYLLPLNSAVLSGITLGERQGLPRQIREDFARTGTAHIIAISGFNVGIVVFAVLFLLKALRIKRKCRYFLAIPILFIHMCAVGAQASVIRATLMAIVVLIGYLLERDADIINSLSLAALIVLGYNPRQVFDIGFQLSFVSVAGIVSLSPRIIGWFKLKPKSNVGLRFLANSFAVSLAAWISTFWLVLYYFRIVTPITVLANLIIVPLVSLVIILGFTLCLSALIYPAIAVPIALTIDFSMFWLFKITHQLGALPFASFYIGKL